jgi:hypothetical protein
LDVIWVFVFPASPCRAHPEQTLRQELRAKQNERGGFSDCHRPPGVPDRAKRVVDFPTPWFFQEPYETSDWTNIFLPPLADFEISGVYHASRVDARRWFADGRLHNQ